MDKKLNLNSATDTEIGLPIVLIATMTFLVIIYLILSYYNIYKSHIQAINDINTVANIVSSYIQDIK